MANTSSGLGRRGRPPAVEVLGGGVYGVTVAGTALKFKQGAKGLKLANRPATGTADDIDYGRKVVEKYIA